MKRPSPALLSEWNAQLRASGFRDLAVGWDDGFLSHRGSGRVDSRHHGANRALRAAYAEFASAVAQHGNFQDARERRIWDLHLAGHGYRAIAHTLGKPETRHRIETTIKRITARAAHPLPKSEGAFRRHIRALVRRTDPRTLLALAALFALARASGHVTTESLTDKAEEVRGLRDTGEAVSSNWGHWEIDTDPVWFVTDNKPPPPGPVRHLVKNGTPVK
jgi:hypothetical protein